LSPERRGVVSVSEESAITARSVLVTGASSGIGEHVAATLIDRGYTVFAAMREPNDGRGLADAGAFVVRLDVTDARSIEEASESVRTRLDGARLGAVVNNAGIGSFGPLELLDTEEIRRVFEVNALGAHAVTRAFLPQLRASRGRIVMISSVSGRIAAPFLGPYAASKFALEALSDSLRREMVPFGVRVVVVQPGPIATPLWGKMRARDVSRLEASAYGPALSKFRTLVEASENAARHPEEVSRAVVRAIEARSPPARLLVTRTPLAMRLLGCLPDRLLDWLVVSRVS
jgi:NAD(P)-dependent dehydrogenase (short-subunit alcohol dehydrogenase family)